MAQLVPPVPHSLIFGQNSAHGAQGAEVEDIIQQLRVDFVGRLIREPLAGELGEHRRFLRGAERIRRRTDGPGRRGRLGLPRRVQITARPRQRLAGTLGADCRSQGLRGLHHLGSSVSGGPGSGKPSTCNNFFGRR